VQWSAVILASAIGATYDIATRRIPNILTISFLAAGLIWAAWRAGACGLADGALGSLIAAGPYLALFVLARGGAGDVKLMAAIGAWLGVVNATICLVCVAMAGTAMAGLWVLWTGHRPSVLGGALAKKPPAVQIAYGPAVFIGVCLAALGVLSWRL
jgi:prepilin peptidase CpaA